MKKIILAFFCAATFLPPFAFAQNAMSPELKALLERLAKLEKQYAELKALVGAEAFATTSVPTPSPLPAVSLRPVAAVSPQVTPAVASGNGYGVSCYKFTTDIRRGDGATTKKAEVAALHNYFAKKEKSADFLAEKKTGVFGAATFRVVVAFQKSYGVSSTGFVGPMTRELLNKLFACPVVKPTPVASVTPSPSQTPTTPVPTPVTKVYPVRVISPNGGEFFYVGTKKMITWDPGSYAGKLVSLFIAPADFPTTTKLIAEGIVGTSYLWDVKYPELGKNTFDFKIIAAPEGKIAQADYSDAPVVVYYGDLGVIPEIALQAPIQPVYDAGDVVRLQWKINLNVDRKFKLTLVDVPTGATKNIATNVLEGIIFDWTIRLFEVPVFVSQKNQMIIPTGPYKIRIECVGGLCQPFETIPFTVRE